MCLWESAQVRMHKSSCLFPWCQIHTRIITSLIKHWKKHTISTRPQQGSAPLLTFPSHLSLHISSLHTYYYNFWLISSNRKLDLNIHSVDKYLLSLYYIPNTQYKAVTKKKAPDLKALAFQKWIFTFISKWRVPCRTSKQVGRQRVTQWG